MSLKALQLYQRSLTLKFIFFSINTTSEVQPLDAGIIASVKMQYRRSHLEHAVGLADVEVNDIYKVDVVSAVG